MHEALARSWRRRAYERLVINEALVGLSPKEQALAKAVICVRLIEPGSDLGTHRYL